MENQNQKTSQPKALAPKRKDIHFVDHRGIIVEEGFNPREDYGDIETLYESIKVNGIQMPLRGFQKAGKWILTDGHRRLKCERMFFEETDIVRRVPILSSSNKLDHRIMEALICGSEGKQLNLLERAKGYERLKKLGYTNTDIARRVGLTRTSINYALILLKAPKDVQDLISNGIIAPSSVIEVIKKYGTEEGVKVIKKAYKALEGSGKKLEFKQFSGKVRFSSLKELKKLVSSDTDRKVKPQMQEMYAFMQKLVKNEITKEELEQLFFE